MYNANRQTPIFEFNPGRLFLDPNNNAANGLLPALVPGYYDSLNNGPPRPGTTLTSTPISAPMVTATTTPTTSTSTPKMMAATTRLKHRWRRSG